LVTSASRQHHVLSVPNKFVQFLINERTLAQTTASTPVNIGPAAYLSRNPIPNPNPN